MKDLKKSYFYVNHVDFVFIGNLLEASQNYITTACTLLESLVLIINENRKFKPEKRCIFLGIY